MKSLFAMMIQFMAWKIPRAAGKKINFGSGAQSVECGHILSVQVRTMREIVAWYDIYWKFLYDYFHWNH
jgi:hypothetical protein